MTDSQRIEALTLEVEDLKAKVDFLLRHAGFTEEELREFRHRTTMPAPPPDCLAVDGV